MKTILFLSTGNDYLSRFSEYLFNYLAETRGLSWRAYSALLPVDKSHYSSNYSMGAIALEVIDELEKRGISLDYSVRTIRPVSQINFKNANKTIAIDESTYRPLMVKRYPSWVNTVEYWNLSDIKPASRESSLQQLEKRINQLINQLAPSQGNLASVWAGYDD